MLQKKRMKRKFFLFILLFPPSLLMAQNEGQVEEDQSVNEIEGLFKKEADFNESRIPKRRRSENPKSPKNISDLKNLEFFSDIAIIQKRYLPKTGRFELFVAGGTNLNDAFFLEMESIFPWDTT